MLHNFLDEKLFVVSGNSEEELKKIIKEIDDNTKTMHIGLCNIWLLYAVSKQYQTSDEKIMCYVLKPEDPTGIKTHGRPVLTSIDKKILDPEFSERFQNNQEVLMFNPETGHIFEVSNLAWTHLINTIKKTETENRSIWIDPHDVSFEKYAYLSSLMNVKKDITLIYKKIGIRRKVYAVLSSKYYYGGLNEMMDLYMAINKNMRTELRNWNITHKIATINLKLFDAQGINEDLIPSMIINNSSIGESSLKITLCWKSKNGGTIIGPNISIQHRFDINEKIDEITEQIHKELYNNRMLYPAKLKSHSELIVPVTNFILNEHTQKKYKLIIEEKISEINKKLETAKVIGKSNNLKYEKLIFSFIENNKIYSMYEIFLLFIKATKGMEDDLSAELQSRLSKNLYKLAEI